MESMPNKKRTGGTPAIRTAGVSPALILPSFPILGKSAIQHSKLPLSLVVALDRFYIPVVFFDVLDGFGGGFGSGLGGDNWESA